MEIKRAISGAAIIAAAFSVTGCSTTGSTTPSSVDLPRQGGPSDPSQRPPTAPAPPIAPPDTGKCDAAKANSAVGSQGTADLLEQARIAAGASVARFLKPNQPITMEYLASRLNLELDDKNIVKSVRCG